MRRSRFPLRLLLAWLAIVATMAAPGARAAPTRLTAADYAQVRAHPEDEDSFSAFLAKLPTFEVKEGGVPHLYYVYEGDLPMTRDEVRVAVIGERRGDDSNKALVSPELIVNVVAGKAQFWPANARTLTYAVDRRSFPDAASYDAVVKAMGEASDAWVKACPACGLSINHIVERDRAPREGQTTFIVRYKPEVSSFIALAFFAGADIEKRYLYVFPPYLRTQYDRVGVFRHELGHILGYRHEQISKDAGCQQSESGDWQPLSPYDPRSVMHYYCNDPVSLNLALSPVDIASHKALYSGVAPLRPIVHGDGAAGAAGLQVVSFATSSGAMPPTSARPDNHDLPAVHVSFVGGTVAKNLAAVLNRLATRPALLPTERVALAAGDNPSKLLKARGIPVPGREFDQLLDLLNGANFSSRTLKVGETIMLPKITVTMRRTVRTFTPEDPTEQRQKQDLLRGWQTKDVLERTVNGLSRVEFDAYDLVIGYQTDKDVMAAIDRLTLMSGQSLRSRNVVIDAELSEARPAKAYSFPANYESICRGPPGAMPPPVHNYDELLDNDAELSALIDMMGTPPGKPTVYVIDTKIALNPALLGADIDIPQGGPVVAPEWRCNWMGFVEALHHGTHMAGIIASRNGQGFAGLAPTSQISSFEWYRANGDTPPKLVEVSRREDNFAAKVDLVTGMPGLSVFLIASEFKPYPSTLLNPDRQLPSIEIRRDFSLAHKAVFAGRPLLIAAAGQSENGEAPVGLTTKSPHAPQGFGDLENVVVVTACVICRHDKVTLLPSAYYGISPDPIVHLAAPGGEPIPGWISSEGVGAAPGTSPAAAYVTGVAAEMIARYPNAYVQAEQVKRRLQQTAWPALPAADPTADAWTKIAAGVVDYQRAQLDPTKSWAHDANGWHAIRIRRWSGPLKVNDPNRGEVSFLPSRVLRLLRLSDAGDDSTYALYADTPTPRVRGLVQRWGPVSLADTSTMIDICGGSSIKLSEISELIVTTFPSQSDNSCG